MLPKNKRIPRKMFGLLVNGAKIFRNDLFLLRLAKSEDGDSRFSFSVSKKVSKSAVVRNKMRRSGYRLLERDLPKIKTNLLVGFIFKKIPKNNEETANSLSNLLTESKLLK